MPIRIRLPAVSKIGLMERFEEVLWLEKVGNPVERVVVDQDRAQQALFRLDIVRRAPEGRSSRVGGELEDVRDQSEP